MDPDACSLSWSSLACVHMCSGQEKTFKQGNPTLKVDPVIGSRARSRTKITDYKGFKCEHILHRMSQNYLQIFLFAQLKWCVCWLSPISDLKVSTVMLPYIFVMLNTAKWKCCRISCCYFILWNNWPSKIYFKHANWFKKKRKETENFPCSLHFLSVFHILSTYPLKGHIYVQSKPLHLVRTSSSS